MCYLRRKTTVGAIDPATMFTIIRIANPWKCVYLERIVK